MSEQNGPLGLTLASHKGRQLDTKCLLMGSNGRYVEPPTNILAEGGREGGMNLILIKFIDLPVYRSYKGDKRIS